MPVVQKIEALLEAVTIADLERMAPTARRRFADRCRRVAEMCERLDLPRARGVLSALGNGERSG